MAAAAVASPPPPKELLECRRRASYMLPGDVVWVKPPAIPYWPAIVERVVDPHNGTQVVCRCLQLSHRDVASIRDSRVALAASKSVPKPLKCGAARAPTARSTSVACDHDEALVADSSATVEASGSGTTTTPASRVHAPSSACTPLRPDDPNEPFTAIFLASKLYYFDRLASPEDVSRCVESRLQRGEHDVSLYEDAFLKAVAEANRIVRIVLDPNELFRTTKLTMQPIGVVWSTFRSHTDAPRQPSVPGGERHSAVIRVAHGFENGLRDVKGFERVWILFNFNYAAMSAEMDPRETPVEASSSSAASGNVELDATTERGLDAVATSRRRPRSDQDRRHFKCMIIPPRDTVAHGVFATRTPHRPNSIGLSCVRVLDVQGLNLYIADHDLLHGTLVLDIKPYLPFCDAHPTARAGWVEDLDRDGRGGSDHKSSVKIPVHVNTVILPGAIDRPSRIDGESGGGAPQVGTTLRTRHS